MRVERDRLFNPNNYQVGDLVFIELNNEDETKSYLYTIFKYGNEYSFMRYDYDKKDYISYNGVHYSFEELINSIHEDDEILEHYSVDEYELLLNKLGGM